MNALLALTAYYLCYPAYHYKSIWQSCQYFSSITAESTWWDDGITVCVII